MNPDGTSESLESAAVAAYREGGWFAWAQMGIQRCPHRGGDLRDDFLSFLGKLATLLAVKARA